MEVDIDKATRREHESHVKGDCSCYPVQEAPVHSWIAGVGYIIKLSEVEKTQEYW